MTTIATRSPERDFLARVEAQAIAHLRGHPEAARRVGMAFLAAMRGSRNPTDYLSVTPASLADCVARSADTQLYPGGPAPAVYLIPQAPRRGEQPELQWRITHRGLAILAMRAGFNIRAVPVSTSDEVLVSYGEAVSHQADPAAWPESLDDLLGVIMVLSRVHGAPILRAWVPAALIRRRASISRDDSVWRLWPIEMAQKTAILWAHARGLIVIESAEWTRAVDSQPPVEEDEAGRAEQPPPRNAREALGLPAPVPEPIPVPVPVPEPIQEPRRRRTKPAPAPDNATAPPAAAPTDDDNPFGDFSNVDV